MTEFVESSFATKDSSDRFNLGTNRLRFIVGNIGEGKSAFIQKLISVIYTRRNDIDNEYRLLTVYFNIEEKYHYKYEPEPLKDTFLLHLFEKICEEIKSRMDFTVDLTEISGINPCNNPILYMKLLISLLKEQKVRLLLFIDNLDFYHYYYARYSFFPEYNKQQEKVINDNIMWLLSVFNTGENLGQMGLNVLIATRGYVYENIVSKSDAARTDINTAEAIRISTPSEQVVISTRLELLSRAIDVVVKNQPGTKHDFKTILNELRYRLIAEKFEMAQESPIKIINRLGQHGNRSLVSFFSSLNLTYLDFELIDRFFVRQVSALYILYFNNMHKKYTQRQNHFPNLFLVDCVVMDEKNFPDAHRPHMHTYWLKYFILKFIVKKNRVKFSEIMDLFHSIGGYDDHLVRHVTGSLCTANEFRCAEIDYGEATKNIDSYKIRPTERGRFFFEKRRDIDVCFDFEYLEVVVDDRWLCFPNPFIKSVYIPGMEYSYLYTTGNSYINASIDSVLVKANSILHFLKVLETSLIIEIQQNKPNLYSILQEYELIPDFDLINNHIIATAENIMASLKKDSASSYPISKLNELRENLKNDDSLQKFLEQYYESGIEVSL